MNPNSYLTAAYLRLFRLLSATLIFTCLCACGGGGSSEPTSDVPTLPESEAQSKLLVSLTDAEGDFLTYQVDVTNITMTRANGAVVNVLPQTTTVDFAQYVEVTELLTIMDAPAGRYDGASMTLDFSSAQITVQDESGNPILAEAVGTDGQPLASTTVDLTFNDNEGFVLAPGIPAQVTLDFDLDASNTIVVEGESATVTVNPILVADTLLEEPKTFRLRGLLEEVDAAEQTFDLALRPFRVRNGIFGTSTVTTSEETSFEIDGVMYDRDEGINVLASMEVGTPTVTEGMWDRDAREYVAGTIYAGASVPWNEADILRGTVVAREGETLTVRGAIIELADGQFTFNDKITVQLSENTIVNRRGDEATSIAQISVGSALYATGDFSEDVLDASEGIVRLLPSSVAGTVVSVSPLVMDLNLVNGRRAGIYDFSGTGVSPESDALADHYEVFTDTIDLSGLSIGEPVRARGYVTDLGFAPEDFNASTVIAVTNVRAHMVVNYGLDGSETAVVSADENGIQLDVDDAQYRHHMAFAGVAIDIKELEQTPLVVPGGERGVYTIWVNRQLEVYTFYDAFEDALNDYLANAAKLTRFDAQGYYNGELATFTSQRVGVVLNDE